MSQMKKKCSSCNEFKPVLGGKIKYKLFVCKLCVAHLDACTHTAKRYDKHVGAMMCEECGSEV